MRDSLWNLTPAETRVARTLRPGCLRYRTVANVLGIKPSTVQSHLSNIRQKMDVRSTAEVMLKIMREGL